METPEIGSHTEGQKQRSRSTIFLEAAMHARLHGQAVREDDSQPRAERIGRPGKRKAIGDAIRVPCRTEHFARGAGSTEKSKQNFLHETESGRLLRRGNT